MATITLKGQPIHTAGNLPAVGSKAPAFRLTGFDLSDVGLEKFAGKRKILNISADLPFAAQRFCESHSLKNVVTLSTFRAAAFGRDYGTLITDGPMAGLQSRAVLILDGSNKVIYTQQVPEVSQEPDYAAVLAALK